MKTISSLCAAVLSVGSALSVAGAAPGDANDDTRVEILAKGKSDCAVRSGMCVYAGAPSTVPAASSPAAGLGAHQAAGTAPSFARTGIEASQNDHASDAVPWTVEVAANLRVKALAGNAVFLVYDADNARALANREVIGAWQATIPAGDALSARITLSPEDGFHAGHTYRIRVVQLIHGKEILLTDGPVRLL